MERNFMKSFQVLSFYYILSLFLLITFSLSVHYVEQWIHSRSVIQYSTIPNYMVCKKTTEQENMYTHARIFSNIPVGSLIVQAAPVSEAYDILSICFPLQWLSGQLMSNPSS